LNLKKNKMVIITGYFKGESYGLLGPQIAATIINDHSECHAIVVAVTNENDKESLKRALGDYFDGSRMIIGFSSLGGRQDLFDFAKGLKDEGAITILAGPQAGPDFRGEIEWEIFEHRFKGLSECFSFAIHGPAQQILPIIESGFDEDLSRFDGVLWKNKDGQIMENQQAPWDNRWLSKVDWQNLYLLKGSKLDPLRITCAQVLQQIGCPYAAKERQVKIQYPESLDRKNEKPFVIIRQKGCSFCDVAMDKGYMGAISEEAVQAQLLRLPEHPDGSKVTFELINENPLPKLARILELAEENSIELSQINLTMRADYFLKGLKVLEATLKMAKKNNIRILLASIGFESFEDTILKNLNKGLSRQANLDAIKAIRNLKPKFPYHFGYLKEEGANHGFIHPTPWDSPQISYEINKTISMYQLGLDILPNHSTPLIIHHASGLADWIRQIEVKEDLVFERIGTTIAWW
jgi:hypothetical protein